MKVTAEEIMKKVSEAKNQKTQRKVKVEYNIGGRKLRSKREESEIGRGGE